MRCHRGLTLIEVLAATALLSLIAASGLGILRQARSGQRHALELVRVATVIDRWDAEVDREVLRRFAGTEVTDSREPPPLPPFWEYQDPDGVRWRAIVTKVDAPSPEEPSEEQQNDAAESWRLYWISVKFECDIGAGTEPRIVSSVLRVFPPEDHR